MRLVLSISMDRPDASTLEDLYIRQKKSYEEIARRYGVTRTSVKRWMRAAGISARSLSDAGKLRKGKETSEAHKRASRRNASRAREAVTPEGLRRGGLKRRGHEPWNKGKRWNDAQREKIMAIRSSPEYKQKLSDMRKGEKNPGWRGGTSHDRNLRHDWKWKEARKRCYERDNWTCQDCGVKCRNKVRIQAHHLIARRDGGTDDLENLITLCASCHRKRERECVKGVKDTCTSSAHTRVTE